jgi:hypothetical protein
MKRAIYQLISAMLLVSLSAKAQNAQQVEQAAKSTANVTTGAQQDVLTDYLQVAAKSITSNGTGLQVKLNWFSLNTDPNRYENTNYYSSYWQRQGELVGFAGTKSWQIGVNYNVLNYRDTTMALYKDAYYKYDKHESAITLSTNSKFQAVILPNISAALTGLVNDAYAIGTPVTDMSKRIDDKLPGLAGTSDGSDIDFLQTTLNIAIKEHAGANAAYLVSAIDKVSKALATDGLSAIIFDYGAGKLKPTDFSGFITAAEIKNLTDDLNQKVFNDPLLHTTLCASTLIQVEQAIQKNYEQQIAFVARQPLLTFGYLYNGVTGTGNPYHQAGLTYLMSFGGAQSTHIGQLNASLTDTLGGAGFTRNIVALQAGYNQVLIVQNKTSLAEINAALEEDQATSGYISGTATNKFYFDAYIRARLPSSPWLKFDLKYDPKGGNVFGLLDFTYNFGQ